LPALCQTLRDAEQRLWVLLIRKWCLRDFLKCAALFSALPHTSHHFLAVAPSAFH
jgi:hypothetical protein